MRYSKDRVGGKEALYQTLGCYLIHDHNILADHANGRAYATVLRLSACRLPSSVTLCIVAKRCVLEQKLLLTA